MSPLKLHVGCGPFVYEGWVNIDKSPSVLLSRAPWLRKALFKLRILTEDQARGFPPGVVLADISKRIPAEDSSVDFIYSSHLIEHLSRWQCLAFAKECHRVLKPGGTVRLATPDLEAMIRDYVDGTSPFNSRQPTRADAFCAEYGAYTDTPGSPVRRLIRKFLSGDSHQWLYDSESLAGLLREGGFTEITSHGFREGALPDLETVEQRERGLFIEAVR